MIHAKKDSISCDLNKFESISSHVKQLDLQVAYIACSIGKPVRFLPRKVEVNPRSKYMNEITLISVKELDEIQMLKQTKKRSHNRSV